MTAILTTIKDKTNGNTLYPTTKTNAITDSNGTSLDSIISSLSQSISSMQSRVSALESEKEFYAAYNITSAVNSFRFQIADAGEFANYEYEFVFKGNTMSASTTLYLRFGNSSSDLDSTSANSRLHAYWDNDSSSNGTVSSYQAASPSYALYYNRVANKDFWGNIKLTPYGASVAYTSLLGRTTNGDIEYRIGYNRVTLADVTHARIYTGSGTITGGVIYVFRTKKI